MVLVLHMSYHYKLHNYILQNPDGTLILTNIITYCYDTYIAMYICIIHACLAKQNFTTYLERNITLIYKIFYCWISWSNNMQYSKQNRS